MNENGKHRDVAVLETPEADKKSNQTSGFYDSNNPLLRQAKEIDASKPKSWKRKLIEFKVRSGDTMCFYAQGADERAQFMYGLADLREQESTSRAALLDAATDVPAAHAAHQH